MKSVVYILQNLAAGGGKKKSEGVGKNEGKRRKEKRGNY